jgi:hypothetical protein
LDITLDFQGGSMSSCIFISTVDSKGNGGAAYTKSAHAYLSKELKQNIDIEYLSMNNDSVTRLIKFINGILLLFLFKPIKCGFLISDLKRYFQILLRLKQFDIVIVDHAETLILISSILKGKDVYYIEHNDEANLYKQRIESTSLKNFILTVDYILFDFCYKASIKYVNKSFSINVNDRDRLKALVKNSYYLPFLLDDKRFLNAYCPSCSSTSEKLKICFMGDYAWWPNFNGISWFIKEVLPSLDNVELHLLGRSVEKIEMFRNVSNVYLLGFVEDLDAYLKDMDLVIVPIFEGAGVNIKLIEAMFLGKYQVVSTRSIEGIKYYSNLVALDKEPDAWCSYINEYRTKKTTYAPDFSQLKEKYSLSEYSCN